jgi:hypothetical protein
MMPLPECPWSESHLVTLTAYGYRFHHLPHHFIDSLFESRHVELGFGWLKWVCGAVLGRQAEEGYIARGVKCNGHSPPRHEIQS